MTAQRTIVSVVGARPNFVKMAPVIAELERRPDEFRSVVVHTGQHYDAEMSQIFFEELGVGEPDHLLGVGSGSHAAQTARVMERIEPILVDEQPAVVLVPGDVNSTLGAAVVAAKLGSTIGHVEAGLRSFDRSMPEEINRIVADALAELLFIHSPEARDNLLHEGHPAEHVHFVGNTMIDTLVRMTSRARGLDIAARLGVEPGTFLLVTLHRPALVDGELLGPAMRALEQVARTMPVVFPCHPRTAHRLEALGISGSEALRLVEPLGYLEFLSLLVDANAVLTDSGGIQEETTYLGIRCFTLRDNTERPVTCSIGTNTLLGLDPQRILEIPDLLTLDVGAHAVPEMWDGAAAVRLVDVLASL